jgi:uncharacterized protein (TIGR02646 family)
VSLSSIPKSLRDEVAKRDGGRCCYCGLLQIGQGSVFHVDHVRPKSKGGATSLDNLALQCPHCSLRKSNKTRGVDPETTHPVDLFDPLAEDWDKHFRLNDDGTIVGISEVGRATVVALAMNELWPRAARSLQVSAGWIGEST